MAGRLGAQVLFDLHHQLEVGPLVEGLDLEEGDEELHRRAELLARQLAQEAAGDRRRKILKRSSGAWPARR